MDKQKQKKLINFKKAQSLLKKVTAMTENDEYCVNIMQQNLAVIGLLKRAHEMLMQGHLNSCFLSAMESKNKAQKQKMIDEILKVTKLYNR
jgi:CsoR family transcriptional regulator, copper-sensing transcriptional repressor